MDNNIPILAFDLETAKILEDTSEIDPEQNLGISCLAYARMESDGAYEEPQHDYGRMPDGSPAPRMSKDEALEALLFLAKRQAKGDLIVTWNGMFDFHVLGIESGDPSLAAFICWRHVDMMLAFHAVKGYFLGLKAASRACGSHKGVDGIQDGALAPVMWAEGRYTEVLNYVKQDAKATLDVAAHLMRNRGFHWLSNSGKMQTFTMPMNAPSIRYMTVYDVARWPQPDQSWMSKRTTRKEILHWMNEALA